MILSNVMNKMASNQKNQVQLLLKSWNKNTQTHSKVVYYEETNRFKEIIDMPHTLGYIGYYYLINEGYEGYNLYN